MLLLLFAVWDFYRRSEEGVFFLFFVEKEPTSANSATDFGIAYRLHLLFPDRIALDSGRGCLGTYAKLVYLCYTVAHLRDGGQ